jgi:aspartate aminotransferase-like enzyme
MNRTRLPKLVDARSYAEIEQRFAQLMDAPQLFLLQGEAMIALEAVARSIGRPGSRALNIVTGPYGDGFGQWLNQQGVAVENLRVPFSQAVSVNDIVSIVHAEAATGVVNPLQEIAALARRAGALTVVDAVASVGAEPLEIERWGLDITVISAQKALGGPAGVTGVAISDAGWDYIAANPSAPRNSVLSLVDWREQWLESDQSVLPTIPNHLETRALDLALVRIGDEGLAHVIARHAQARDACRRGVRALGLAPWIDVDAEAAAVATTVSVPAGVAPDELVAASLGAADGGLSPAIGVAPGPLAKQAIRISHTGPRATTAEVLSAVAALGLGLGSLGIASDIGAATAAVTGG